MIGFLTPQKVKKDEITHKFFSIEEMMDKNILADEKSN